MMIIIIIKQTITIRIQFNILNILIIITILVISDNNITTTISTTTTTTTTNNNNNTHNKGKPAPPAWEAERGQECYYVLYLITIIN